MNWKDKRKRKAPEFFSDDEDDDFFSGFDDISKVMNDMMKRAFEGSFTVKPIKMDKPMVYGFSMKMGPDGQPKFEEFGNVQPKEKKIKQEREPLVDVIEKEKEISVIAELPGVEKKDIDLEVKNDGTVLKINVPKLFYKEIALPSEVKDNAQAQYKNGVLEVNLTKIKATKPKEKKIKVE